MMKKVLTILIAVALLSMASVTAFAAGPITSIGGSDSADVKGTYAAGTAATTVYSVDIAWGSMEFTYTAGSAGTWNPSTHAYGGSGAGSWSCGTDANKITVTNHSNAAITAQFRYTPETGYDGINGAFSKDTLVLDSAVGTTYASAPSESATLDLSGVLSSDTPADTTIGTVTVTLQN